MEISNLRKSFGENILYENLNFTVRQGEIFALIGPNGVGKTTLMKMILGWDRDYEGQIRIDEGQVLSYSPESPDFPSVLTGLETIDFFMEVRGVKEDGKMIMKTVGLDPESKTLVKDYSKGMKQRLGVGQALIGDPDLLLLDEPSAGLDYFGQRQMQDLMERLKDNGKTILLNSHMLYDVEQICDRGIIIMDSKNYRHFDKKEFENESLGDMFINLAKEARNVNLN